MDQFALYAQYYDLLYKDKDYAAEAGYVHQLIAANTSGGSKLLSLGCGTGKHDYELAKLGYNVTGVDLSPEMIAQAEANSPTDLKESLRFVHGDIRNVILGETYDNVISLFHVMSYQITNQDLSEAIDTAYDQLNNNGLFVFDCWYGPGVLTDPPVVRIKRIADDSINVTRLAEPVVDTLNNTVEVNYTIMLGQQDQSTQTEIKESHKMRYLFVPEISLLIAEKFKMIAVYDWLTVEEPTQNSWNAVFILQKI